MAYTKRKIKVLINRNDLLQRGIREDDVLDAFVSGNRARPSDKNKKVDLLRGEWRFATAQEVQSKNPFADTQDGSVVHSEPAIEPANHAAIEPADATGENLPNGSINAEETQDRAGDGEPGFPPLEDAESEDPDGVNDEAPEPEQD